MAQVRETELKDKNVSVIQCFVVSLLRATERRTAISSALAELDIPFSFVDAVDATNGLGDNHASLIKPHPDHPMSPQEYGCALSHAAIYQKIVESGIEHALILEDDAIPLPQLRTFLDRRCYEIRPLFQLFHGAAYVQRRGTIELFDSVVARPLSMSCSHTVAYTVNQNAARALLQATQPVRYKADWPLDLSVLDACITQPVIVQHPVDRTHSYIAPDRCRRPKPARRYMESDYYRRKWRKLCSQRVRSSPESADPAGD